MNHYKIVLVSSSSRRKELMTGLGVDYVVKTLLNVDESYPGSLQGEEIPLLIARKKAAVYQLAMYPGEFSITADTIVWHEGKALGKPSGHEDAIEMSRNLSSKSHQVITGAYLTACEWQKSFAVVTDVRFATLDENEIIYYVDHYQPMNKAGSYGAQERIGFTGVEPTSGSYFNVMGLPIQRLYRKSKQLWEAVFGANFTSLDFVWHFPCSPEGGEYHMCLSSWRDQGGNLSCVAVIILGVDYLFSVSLLSIPMLIIVLPHLFILYVPRLTKEPGQNKILHR